MKELITKYPFLAAVDDLIKYYRISRNVILNAQKSYSSEIVKEIADGLRPNLEKLLNALDITQVEREEITDIYNEKMEI